MPTFIYQIIDSTTKELKEILQRDRFINRIGSIVLGQDASLEEKTNYVVTLENLAVKHKMTTYFISWGDEFQIIPHFEEEEVSEEE